MTIIAEGDGYVLARRRAGKSTDYRLTMLVDGLEHHDDFDRVDVDGPGVVEIREIPRWGDAAVGELDPGVLETDVGAALEVIARGEDPREVVEA